MVTATRFFGVELKILRTRRIMDFSRLLLFPFLSSFSFLFSLVWWEFQVGFVWLPRKLRSNLVILILRVLRLNLLPFILQISSYLRSFNQITISASLFICLVGHLN